MPENQRRIYSIEILSGDYSFYRESFIPSGMDYGAVRSVCRVIRKILTLWTQAEFQDQRDIVIRFISSKQF